MAGCLAGIHNPNATILEASESPQIGHQALLRFRTPAIEALTGIPMKRAMVQKAIFVREAGGFVPVSPRWANLYSLKTVGQIQNRSIWELDPVERFIPPKDFYSQLQSTCMDQIKWGTRPTEIGLNHIKVSQHNKNPMVTMREQGEPIISTIPIPKLAKLIGREAPQADFTSRSIHILKFTIPGEAYQTIYFPGADTPIYRASITGNELIIESMKVVAPMYVDDVLDAFGIPKQLVKLSGVAYEQKLGKIIPMDNLARRQFLHQTTLDFRIFALGRFATWRSLVLDDVVLDLSVIRQMIHADQYELVRRENQDES